MRSTRPLLFALLLREPRILPLRTGLARGRATITGLHAKTGRKNELADCGAEAAQEGVEGLDSGRE